MHVMASLLDCQAETQRRGMRSLALGKQEDWASAAYGLAWPKFTSHRRLTKGFSQPFYDAYHAINPRSEPHYEQRIRLYELYHHLNVSSITTDRAW